MAKDEHKIFKALVIILFLFNTFFIAGIWYSLTGGMCGYSSKKFWCPLSATKPGKICPLTGKPLPAGGTDQAQP